MYLALIARTILALALTAQVAPQNGAPRPIGTATITGRVVDGANDLGIGSALVTLAGAGFVTPERTFADSDGVFTFRFLPAGTYNISTKRGGFLDAELGQRRPNGPSRTLKIADDQRRDDVVVRMFKPAAISGTITDEVGEPAVKVAVRAYRRSFASGRAVLAAVNDDVTDDRGVYRLGRLEPGEYVIAALMATTTPLMGGGPTPLMIRDGGSSATHLPPLDGKLQKFPTTYYPAGSSAANATIVTVGLGELRRAIDLQLRPQKVVNIAGNVTVATGIARGVHVDLIAAGEDEVGGDRSTASTVTGPSGSFSFGAIPSGQYILRASVKLETGGQSAAVPQWAEQLIAVNDKDLSDVSLFMRRGFGVSGRFEFDGQSDNTSEWGRSLTVSLDPASQRYVTTTPPTVIVNVIGKTFTATDVLPGRYLVRVNVPGGRSVKSVMYQGRDVTQTPLVLDAADIGGLVVTLTDRPNVLSGTVAGSGDVGESTVLVFPQDPQSWIDFGANPNSLRTVDVNSLGAYETRGLPAGDYLVIAFDQDTPVDAQNPAFLQVAARLATHVRVGDGERQVVDLKIVTLK